MHEQLPKEGKKLEWSSHIVGEMTFDNYAACVKTWNLQFAKQSLRKIEEFPANVTFVLLCFALHRC